MGPKKKIVFYPIFVSRKGFLSLEKLFLVPILQCVTNSKIHSDNKGKFIDKIVGYSIYALTNLSSW